MMLRRIGRSVSEGAYEDAAPVALAKAKGTKFGDTETATLRSDLQVTEQALGNALTAFNSSPSSTSLEGISNALSEYYGARFELFKKLTSEDSTIHELPILKSELEIMQRLSQIIVRQKASLTVSDHNDDLRSLQFYVDSCITRSDNRTVTVESILKGESSRFLPKTLAMIQSIRIAQTTLQQQLSASSSPPPTVAVVEETESPATKPVMALPDYVATWRQRTLYSRVRQFLEGHDVRFGFALAPLGWFPGERRVVSERVRQEERPRQLLSSEEALALCGTCEPNRGVTVYEHIEARLPQSMLGIGADLTVRPKQAGAMQSRMQSGLTAMLAGPIAPVAVEVSTTTSLSEPGGQTTRTRMADAYPVWLSASLFWGGERRWPSSEWLLGARLEAGLSATVLQLGDHRATQAAPQAGLQIYVTSPRQQSPARIPYDVSFFFKQAVSMPHGFSDLEMGYTAGIAIGF